MRTLRPGASRTKRPSQVTVLVIAALLRPSRVIDDLQAGEIDYDFDDVLGESNAAGGFVVDGKVFAHFFGCDRVPISFSCSLQTRLRIVLQ